MFVPAIPIKNARRDWAAFLGLLFLVVFLFRKAVFAGEALYDRDLGFWYYPQVESIVRIVTSGSWPLWDPYMSFGMPLLANPSTQVLYPFTVLHLFLEPWTFYTVYVVCHLVLSGMGQYLLARRIGLSELASFAAAAAWTASGPLLSLVNMWHHFSGAAWIPWVLLAALRASESQRPRDALLWGGAIAGQILTGSADMCAIAALGALVASFGQLRLSNLRDRSNLRWLSVITLAFGFGLAVTAAQWIPSLDLIRDTLRSGLPEFVRTYWSVPPLALLQSVIPLATKGLALDIADPLVRTEMEQPLLYSLYLGAGIVVLALCGFAGERRPRQRLFAFLFISAVLVSLGRHSFFYAALVALLPPLSIVRFPVKALILTPLAGGLLAGMGIDAWPRAASQGHWWARWVVGWMAALACACAVAAGLALAGTEGWLMLPVPDTPRRSEVLTAIVWRASLAALACVALGMLALRASRQVTRGRWLRPAVAAIAIVELASAHVWLNPTAPVALFAQRPATVGSLAADGATRLTRIYTFDYFWPVMGKKQPSPEVRAAINPHDQGGPPGLARVLGLRMLYPASGRWEIASSFDRDNLGLGSSGVQALVGVFRATEETPHFARLLAMASVRYVFALHSEGLEDLVEVAALPSPLGLPIRIFKVKDPLPHAYAVGRGRVLEPGTLLYSALTDERFDAWREVILGDGPVIVSDGFSGSVRTVGLESDRVIVETDFNKPGYLVLTDAYNSGWKATIDDRPAVLERANIAFRAIQVPAGRHRVVQVYRPWSVPFGIAVSTLALVAGVGLALSRRDRDRSPCEP